MHQNSSKNHIRFLRQITRMSQPDLALVMSRYSGTVIDTTTVSKHESSGSSRPPTPEDMQAYASVFKLPIYALYEDLCTREKLIELLFHEGKWWDELAEVINHG